MVLALLAVTAVLGRRKLRGFASLGLGLAIGLVGIDPVTGQQRLIFGQPLLADGMDIVVVAVAIFAVGEALWVAAHLRRNPLHVIPVGQPWMGKEDWKRSWKPWLRGTAFGFPFGALPAGGAEIPTFLSYVTEKRLSKHPEEFGHGAIEGVAGPEAANNASAAGTLTPMLALGLPTNATAAVMLAAFISIRHPARSAAVREEPQLVWALIVWASQDRVMPPEHGRRLAGLLPGSELVEVDDSYTLIPLDQPARLAQAIRGFALSPAGNSTVSR